MDVMYPGFFIGARDMESLMILLEWIAEFLKYLCGFTTQDEEDWFDNGRCNDFQCGSD